MSLISEKKLTIWDVEGSSLMTGVWCGILGRLKFDGRSDFSASRRFRRLLKFACLGCRSKKSCIFGVKVPNRGDKVFGATHASRTPYVAKTVNLDGAARSKKRNFIITTPGLISFFC